MWLLVSWAHCSSTVKSSLADSEHLHDWLKKLTLLVPEVSLPSIKTSFFYGQKVQFESTVSHCKKTTNKSKFYLFVLIVLFVFFLLGCQPAVRHEACNGLYKLSLSGLEGGESINRSFLLLAASTLLKFLPDAQALKPLRVSLTHNCHPARSPEMHLYNSCAVSINYTYQHVTNSLSKLGELNQNYSVWYILVVIFKKTNSAG